MVELVLRAFRIDVGGADAGLPQNRPRPAGSRLSNGNDVLDTQTAATPAEAARVAVMMVASREVEGRLLPAAARRDADFEKAIYTVINVPSCSCAQSFDS